jgi:ABC-type sugar transport system permease subunit
MSITMIYVSTEYRGEEEGAETCHEQHLTFKKAITFIWWVHVTCFILLLATLFAHYLNQKLAGVMKYVALLTIPLYQATIMYVFALYNDESGCVNELRSIKFWLEIEVFTFFIYMSIILWTLLKSRFSNLGII